MNMRKLMAVLIVMSILTCGCISENVNHDGHPRDDDGEPYWPPTMLDWALWVASWFTWDDAKEFAKWALSFDDPETREWAWEMVEWYIKMLIIADAHTEG